MNDQKILFTPALSGRETEFKINIFLEPEIDNASSYQNFKTIIFSNGMQCISAEIGIGEGFISKNILIGIVEDEKTSKDFIERVSSFVNIIKNPHLYMMLGGDDPLTVFPHLYCNKKKIFLLVKNDNVDFTISEIINSIKGTNGNGYFCSQCEHYDFCYNQKSSPDILSYFNKRPANLFFLEDCGLNLLEESQLASCYSLDEYNYYQHCLDEEKSLRKKLIQKNKPVVFGEKDVSKLIIRKLKLFQAFVQYVLDVANAKSFPLTSLTYDNFYIKEPVNNQERKLVYLPIIDIYEKQRLQKLKLVKDATARIVNENNHYFLEFRKTLADDSIIKQGEIIGVFLGKYSEKESVIFCKVKSVDNDYYLLDIENKNFLFTDSSLIPEFMQDMHKPITYFIKKDMPGPRDELYFLFLNILLRNSVMEEDELLHAKNILFGVLNKKDYEVGCNDIAEIFHTNSALSIVFRQENLFYKPTTEVINKLSDFHWLSILLWMIQFSENLCRINVEQNQNQLIQYLEQSQDKLEELIREIDICFTSKVTSENEEKFIIKNALQGLVEDGDWLNRILGDTMPANHASDNLVQADSKKSFNSASFHEENTMLMPKNDD